MLGDGLPRPVWDEEAMKPKDILAFVDSWAARETFLPHALAASEAWGAHVTIAVVTALPAIPLYAPVSATHPTYQSLKEELLRTAAEKCEVVNQVVDARSTTTVLPLTQDVSLISAEAAQLARYADLVIMPPIRACASRWLREHIAEEILQSSGRPVLMADNAPAPKTWSHVVLAWNKSREAARAWHDVLPLLPEAAHVDIVVGSPALRPDELNGNPGANIRKHIEREGFTAEVHELTIHRAGHERRTQAEVLLGFAQERKADLVVVGAVSHLFASHYSLTEATRDVLNYDQLPLFLST